MRPFAHDLLTAVAYASVGLAFGLSFMAHAWVETAIAAALFAALFFAHRQVAWGEARVRDLEDRRNAHMQGRDE